jgi:hypothetical protein
LIHEAAFSPGVSPLVLPAMLGAACDGRGTSASTEFPVRFEVKLPVLGLKRLLGRVVPTARFEDSMRVFRLCRPAICLSCIAAARLDSQTTEPGLWLGGSVGFGTAFIGNMSVSGTGAEVAGGVTITRQLNVGGRLLGFTELNFFGDQPGWSSRTKLLVASYIFSDAPFAVSSGIGTMSTRQKDNNVRGESTVLETGVEMAWRRGASVRLVALETWTLGHTRWSGSSFPSGNARQFFAGVGILFR